MPYYSRKRWYDAELARMMQDAANSNHQLRVRATDIDLFGPTALALSGVWITALIALVF